MKSKKPFWTDHDIENIKPIAERTRQSIIQYFPDWLKRQSPKEGTPDAVGEFKHKMIHKVGGNLQRLNLEELHDDLVRYTNDSIKKVELIASAHQIVREISLWLTTNSQATNFARIAELRALQKIGNEYASKIRSISSHIEMPEITEISIQLSKRVEEIKQSLSDLKKRASKLWQSKLRTVNEAEELLNEVSELFSIFEGCKEDVDDLQLMRRSLRIYIQAYQQLSNDQLDLREFNILVKKLEDEVTSSIGEDLPPWEPTETISNFKNLILKNREEKSLAWIENLESEASDLEGLNATDVNSLHARATYPPAILSNSHHDRLNKICSKIELRLSKIKIEWLIEKFKELGPDMQKEFLSRIPL